MTLNEKASSPQRGPPAEGVCTLAALMAGTSRSLKGTLSSASQCPPQAANKTDENPCCPEEAVALRA